MADDMMEMMRKLQKQMESLQAENLALRAIHGGNSAALPTGMQPGVLPGMQQVLQPGWNPNQSGSNMPHHSFGSTPSGMSQNVPIGVATGWHAPPYSGTEPAMQPGMLPLAQTGNNPIMQNGTPATQQGVQPGMQHGTPATQQGVQLGMQHGTPATQQGVQPGMQHGTPATQQGEQPGTVPLMQPQLQSGMQYRTPAMQQGVQPGTVSLMQPQLQPGMQHGTPATQQGVQPVTVPFMQPQLQAGMQHGTPATQQGVQPGTVPLMQPQLQAGVQHGTPATQQGGQPSATVSLMQPGMQNGTPGMQQGVQPGTVPLMQPQLQAGMQPGVQQGTQPTMQSAIQLQSQPVCSQCNSGVNSPNNGNTPAIANPETLRLMPGSAKQQSSKNTTASYTQSEVQPSGMDGPAKNINILILGETGVGKSTWINAFVNYIEYDTLADAEASNLRSLIPSKFTVIDDQFKKVTVCTGEDANENSITGHSATQDAKVYSIPIAPNLNLRLIDTPGIGDTRGMDQDKLNFQSILSAISKLDELHGICILLKPNNSRLTVVFRFCITELLTYLHRDASKNIVFCFTNSRGTFYRPGDTLPALEELLKKHGNSVSIPINQDTIYCFDSESYRFLAAVKNNPPVKFPGDERENFAKSWEKSVVETSRLLMHITHLVPHPTQSTLNLNHARQMILQMTRPLAEIARNIQTNKAIILDEKREIENMNENLEELRKMIMTTRTEIEVTHIDEPRTVCSNSDCVKIWPVGESGNNTTEYVTVCHEDCQLSDVVADSVGDPGLIRCWAMQNTNYCTVCSHHYKQHLHIYYESNQKEVQVENEAVKESISQNLNAAETKQRMIDEKNQLLQENEDEANAIRAAAADFAMFLKSNAITPYNDAMEAYLDHLIREEQNKVALGGARKTLEGLLLEKGSYLEKIEILEKAMRSGTSRILSSPEVASLIKKLKTLKHNGLALQKALDSVNHTSKNSFKENMVNVKIGSQSGWGNKIKNGVVQLYKKGVFNF